MCKHEHHHHGGCCCGGFKRRFFTKEEKIAKLESYLKDLKAEAAAVEAEIKRLKEEK